jgi:hypothetical protein
LFPLSGKCIEISESAFTNYIKAVKHCITALPSFLMLVSLSYLSNPVQANQCNYPDDLDSRGYRCGGRAASERPGGRNPSPQTQPNTSNENAKPATVLIEGEGFSGYCQVKPSTNIRSGASIGSGVVETTVDAPLLARVYTTEFHEPGLWAWTTVAFGNHHMTNGWIRADLLQDCHQ